jgi:ABC-2 type transport system ATP-binding protein
MRAPADTDAAVEALELRHRYGERVALDGVSFRVGRGELFGLLGPNGGGKSTVFRVLSTLVRPSGGRARVLGHDVVEAPDAVRRAIGVVFQHPSVDPLLGVEENVVHHGHLYGIGGAELRARVATVLPRLGLAAVRGQRVGTLSGGLKRRVELAKALLTGARVLLLDEPSSGLDPVARREFLAMVGELRAEGISIVLTTHDMDEAERCDRVAFLDRGRLVATDSPDALKAAVGGDVLVVQTATPEALRDALRTRLGLEGRLVDGVVRLEQPRAHELVPRLIDAFGTEVRAVTYGKPTLEDVFVHLTGRPLSAPVEEG